MRVIIAGGSGLIGKALARQLTKSGNEVFIMTRNPEKIENPLNGVRYIKWDGRTAEGWSELVDGVDAIVSLAGENLSAGRWTRERKQLILSSRVNAGNAIVQAIAKARNKPGVLIQASGVGYYGTQNPNMLTESDPMGDDFFAGIACNWEDSTLAVETMGVRRVIIRSGVVFSKKALALRLLLLPIRFFIGGPLGSGRQWLSWIHIDDEIRAIQFLIENPNSSGAFNLSAEPVTNAQFATMAAKVLKRPASLRTPAFLLRLMLGEMSSMVLEGQRVSADKLINLGFQFNYPRLNLALPNLIKKQ